VQIKDLKKGDVVLLGQVLLVGAAQATWDATLERIRHT
jgi:hypothetical protein